MSSKSKLTSEIVERIHKRSSEGAGYRELREEFGVSDGTIRNVLSGKLPKSISPPRKASPPPRPLPDLDPDDPIGAPLADDVRAWLGLQVRDLREECRRLRRDGPPQAYAAASRNLTMTSLAYARLTPKPAEDPALHPDMVQAAEECRIALHSLLDRVLEDPDHPFRHLPGRGSPG